MNMATEIEICKHNVRAATCTACVYEHHHDTPPAETQPQEKYGEEHEQLAPLCLCLNSGPNNTLRNRPFITDAHGNVVVEGFQSGDQTGLDSHIQRLQEIVRSVNSHAALVAGLRKILTEAEFVADAKAPFSTWIAGQCRALLRAAGEGVGEDDNAE